MKSKPHILPWIGIAVLILLSACTEEVEVNVSGPAANIIYCLLDPDEDAQYVRIGRSFSSLADPGVPPHQDSISWKREFTVYMEELGENQDIERVIYFYPDVEIEKDTGFFPTEGLAVYKADFKPGRLTTYNLYVHFRDEDLISSGTTTVPGHLRVHNPRYIPGRKMNFHPGSSYLLRWEPAEKAGVYQADFTFTYRETAGEESGFKNILLKSDIYVENSGSQFVEKYVNGGRFFEECLKQVDAGIDAVREIVNVSFDFYTGGEEYGLYIYSQTGGNNLSSGSNNYTNINNGTGIFSSLISYHVSGLELSNVTLDRLAYDEKTTNLGFLDHYGKR